MGKRGGFKAAYLSSGTALKPYQRHFVRQAELFPIKKEPRVFRMRMVDTGPNDCVGLPYLAKFKCHRCGTESDWWECSAVEVIKRGIPCPKCNPKREGDA